MQYEDIEKIMDYMETLSDKTIILDVPFDIIGLDWTVLKMYAEKIDFIMCIHNLSIAQECNNNNIKFYWAYPITSYYELRGVVALKPSYVLLGAPLSFDLPNVKSICENIPIRLCPNMAYDAYIPRENGICGHWIRPEDTGVYSQYVDAFEFRGVDLKQERVLYHVYAENGNWPGNLNLLLVNFGVNVDNRAIPEEIGELRTKCGQKCMTTNRYCRFCINAVKFAEAIRQKHEQQASKELN